MIIDFSSPQVPYRAISSALVALLKYRRSSEVRRKTTRGSRDIEYFVKLKSCHLRICRPSPLLEPKNDLGGCALAKMPTEDILLRISNEVEQFEDVVET